MLILPSIKHKKHLRNRNNETLYYVGRVETHLFNEIGYIFNKRGYIGIDYLFEEYRHKQVYLINKYFDAVLAVSDRVRQIASFYGIDSSILFTEYIGSKLANQHVTPKSIAPDDILRIVFMGYMKEEKGLPFLLMH